MAAELMLINPRRKRRVTRVRKNPRRKMTALQRKYFGPRKRRRAASAVTTVRSNPVRHRRRRRSVTRVRRNPMSMRKATSGITSALMPAAIGAGGAFVLNYAYSNYLSSSLPSSMTSGAVGAITQIGLSMGLGMLAGMAFGKQIGTQVAAGAITVTVYSLAQSYMSGNNSLGGTGGAGNYSSLTGNYGLGGLGVRPQMRGPKRLGRYVGNQLAGNVPRNLNGMAGNVPRNLNGLAAQPAKMRRRMNGLGYTGPARIARMGRYVGRN